MDVIEQFVLRYYTLSSTSLKEFQKLFTQKNYKKNDVLYRVGESKSQLFLMTEGIARSVVMDSNGKEKTRTIFNGPSVFTSLTSNLYGEPFATEFNCLTEATMYEGSFENFIKLTEKRHDISILYNKFLEEAFINMQEKATILSTLDATDRYLYLKNRIPDIEKHIQLNHIASYLNMTSIQLSRIRKKVYSK